MVFYLQFLVGKDPQTGHANGRAGSPRPTGLLQLGRERHLLELHSRRQSLQTVASRPIELSAGGAARLGRVGGPRTLFSWTGNENSGQRVAGYPL